MRSRLRRGFTLVELLVVIAIIALLLAILLPAVQSVRNAARRATCMNQERQLALGILNYASANSDRLPGLSDRRSERLPNYDDPPGFGRRPWTLTILPFVEEQALFDQLQPFRDWDVIAQSTGEEPADAPPLVAKVFSCPESGMQTSLQVFDTKSGDVLYQDVNRCAYTAIAGIPRRRERTKPRDLGAWHSRTHDRMYTPPRLYSFEKSSPTGWEHQNTRQAKLKWITDGLSKTLLLAESEGATWIGWRYKDPFSRFAYDRGTPEFPHQPIRNEAVYDTIFARHGNGSHFLYCDGSAKFVKDDIEPLVIISMVTRAEAE